jgi:hypothetical protein
VSNVRRMAIAVIAAVSLAVAMGTAVGASSTVCVPVRATGIGQDLGNFRTRADIFVGGVRVGSTAATFAPTGQVGSTVTFSGPIEFTARLGLGTLTVSATGSVDVTTGVFESAGPVTAATGALRGTSGALTFRGTENLSTGAFTESVTGQLCATAPSTSALFAS